VATLQNKEFERLRTALDTASASGGAARAGAAGEWGGTGTAVEAEAVLTDEQRNDGWAQLRAARQAHDSTLPVTARVSGAWKCDGCGHMMGPEYTACSACRRKRGEGAGFVMGKGAWWCPCLCVNGAEATVCRNCAADKAGVRLEASALDWLCSEHGHANHASWSSCVKCGGEKVLALYSHCICSVFALYLFCIRTVMCLFCVCFVFPLYSLCNKAKFVFPLYSLYTKATGLHHLHAFEKGQRLWACLTCQHKSPLGQRECSKCSAEGVHSKAVTARSDDARGGGGERGGHVNCPRPSCSHTNPVHRATCAICESALGL
jgi:hypothetical protein